MARHRSERIKKTSFITIIISSLLLVSGAILTFALYGWPQGTAILIALVPLPLVGILLQVYAGDADDEDELEAALTASIKVGAVFAVGWAITLLSQAAKVPATGAGIGLLFAGLIAIASWSQAVDVIMFALRKSADRASKR